MKTSYISWVFNRLKTMSVGEIVYRISETLKKQYDKTRYTNRIFSYELEMLPESVLNIEDEGIDSFDKKFVFFGMQLDITKPINWHLDIGSGKEFPISPSFNIDIRTNKNGSAKNVWEINRMQFLIKICYAYLGSNEKKHLNLFKDIISSWHKQNPYLLGVNWYSNIEVNIRLINWFLCWEILNATELIQKDSEFKDFTEEIWLPLIFMHCKYSNRYPSKFSSANNHLVSEHAGLFVASSFWKFKDSDNWSRKAKRGLEKEMIKQHSVNGINKEQASEYIQFITDFFLIAYIVGLNKGNAFSEAFSNRLHNIFRFINCLLDVNLNFVKYGDEDDGRVFILEKDDIFNNFQSLLVSGAILFKDGGLKKKAERFDQKNKVLFGKKGLQIFTELPIIDDEPLTKFYPEEGHFYFKDYRKGKELLLFFDSAPLGFLSIAAHGHADALSFILNVDGEKVFVDPGTYTYHTDFEFRKYFIGTLAHNTIRIDEFDQAKLTGPTMWHNHYKSMVIDYETLPDNDYVYATHSGYNKLGVQHFRKLTFHKESSIFIIEDEVKINDNRTHILEIPFHLHPEIIVKKRESGWQLQTKKGHIVQLILPEQLNTSIIEGQLSPILGWYSNSFGHKTTCSVIYNRLEINASVKLITEIKILLK